MKKTIFGLGLTLTFAFVAKQNVVLAVNDPVDQVMECNLSADQKNAIATNLDKFLKDNNIPKTANGKSVNKSVYSNHCIIVYGSSFGDYDKGEYRYLGYASDGETEITNPYFPNDSGGDTVDWTWRNPLVKTTDGIGTSTQRINALGRTVDTLNISNRVAMDLPIRGTDYQYYLKIPNNNTAAQNSPYGYNKHAAYIEWDATKGTYVGKVLNNYAEMLILPTTYTGGIFKTYNYGKCGCGDKKWYATYYMASYKSAVPNPKYDLSLDSSSFTISPTNPKPDENVTITFNAELTSTYDGDTKTFNNVPLKFGWKTGNTNYNWCTTISTIKVGDTVKITLNSSQNKNCAVPSQTRSDFVYPGEGGRQVFYAEINQDENNPSDETSYSNNYFFKSVVGTVLPDDPHLTLEHFPKYPSTKVDGAQGSYYKASYDYKAYGYKTDMVYPTSVNYTFSLKDPKSKVLTSGTGTNALAGACFNSTSLVYSCGDFNFYLANATSSFSSVPDASSRLFYSNVGTNNMQVNLTEKGWHVYQTYDLTKCNKDSYCTPTTNKVSGTLTHTVTLSTDISGISTGVGK